MHGIEHFLFIRINDVEMTETKIHSFGSIQLKELEIHFFFVAR